MRMWLTLSSGWSFVVTLGVCFCFFFPEIIDVQGGLDVFGIFKEEMEPTVLYQKKGNIRSGTIIQLSSFAATFCDHDDQNLL